MVSDSCFFFLHWKCGEYFGHSLEDGLLFFKSHAKLEEWGEG